MVNPYEDFSYAEPQSSTSGQRGSQIFKDLADYSIDDMMNVYLCDNNKKKTIRKTTINKTLSTRESKARERSYNKMVQEDYIKNHNLWEQIKQEYETCTDYKKLCEKFIDEFRPFQKKQRKQKAPVENGFGNNIPLQATDGVFERDSYNDDIMSPYKQQQIGITRIKVGQRVNHGGFLNTYNLTNAMMRHCTVRPKPIKLETAAECNFYDETEDTESSYSSSDEEAENENSLVSFMQLFEKYFY